MQEYTAIIDENYMNLSYSSLFKILQDGIKVFIVLKFQDSREHFCFSIKQLFFIHSNNLEFAQMLQQMME